MLLIDMPENFKDILLKRYHFKMHNFKDGEKWPPIIKEVMLQLAHEIYILVDRIPLTEFIGYVPEGYEVKRADWYFSRYLIIREELKR